MVGLDVCSDTTLGTVALEGNRRKGMAVDAQGRRSGRQRVERLEQEARTRGISRKDGETPPCN